MPRLFIDELKDLRGGELVDELTDAMAKLVLAVTEQRKAGSLTLKLSVRPMSANSGVLVVADSVDVKLPQKAVDETLMFASPEGSLLAENPAQKKLDLKEAPPLTSGKVIDVNAQFPAAAAAVEAAVAAKS